MREKGSLVGAAAIVTGASSGIGYGIASRLAVDGAAVAINYPSQCEPAEQLRGEIERSGGRAIVVGGDVSKEADVASLFDLTVEAFGRVDCESAPHELTPPHSTISMSYRADRR